MPALATSDPTALRMSDKRNPYIAFSQQGTVVAPMDLTAPATPITDAMIPKCSQHVCKPSEETCSTNFSHCCLCQTPSEEG